MTTNRPNALVICNSRYEDETLSTLVAPNADASGFSTVIEDPKIGGYSVKSLSDEDSYTVSRNIEEFFADRKREDTILFYYSGHGILNTNGQLYFAARNTIKNLPRSTAIPASFLRDAMDNCRSNRQIVFLDCCYSGAFARGSKGEPGSTVQTGVIFSGNGYGRVVFAASDATQYAWEDTGNEVSGSASRSVFTKYLILGLQTGDADTNRDGYVTTNELFEYIYDRVLGHALDTKREQTPCLFGTKIQGGLIICQNPYYDIGLTPAPVEKDSITQSATVFRNSALLKLLPLQDYETQHEEGVQQAIILIHKSMDAGIIQRGEIIDQAVSRLEGVLEESYERQYIHRAWANYYLGVCHYVMRRDDEAVKYFQESRNCVVKYLQAEKTSAEQARKKHLDEISRRPSTSRGVAMNPFDIVRTIFGLVSNAHLTGQSKDIIRNRRINVLIRQLEVILPQVAELHIESIDTDLKRKFGLDNL